MPFNKTLCKYIICSGFVQEYETKKLIRQGVSACRISVKIKMKRVVYSWMAVVIWAVTCLILGGLMPFSVAFLMDSAVRVYFVQ